MATSLPLGDRLPARLRAVAALVPAGARVADIGAGHGLLPLWLLAASRAESCIATERNRESGPRLSELGDTPRLEIRFGDGLRVLRASDDVDVLVVSGLGARSILSILEMDPELVAGIGRIVVQPQTEAGLLRRGLVGLGRTIAAERITHDRGRFYVSIAADRGGRGLPRHPRLSEEELLEAGPYLVVSGDPLVRRYWQSQANRLARILARAPAATARSRARQQARLVSRVLDALLLL